MPVATQLPHSVQLSRWIKAREGQACPCGGKIMCTHTVVRLVVAGERLVRTCDVHAFCHQCSRGEYKQITVTVTARPEEVLY